MLANTGLAIFFIILFFLHRTLKKDAVIVRWAMTGSWLGVVIGNTILMTTKSSTKGQYYLILVLAFFIIFIIGLVFNLVDQLSRKKTDKTEETQKVHNVLIPDLADFSTGIVVGIFVFFSLTLGNSAHLIVFYLILVFFFVTVLASVLNRKIVEINEKIRALEKRFSD